MVIHDFQAVLAVDLSVSVGNDTAAVNSFILFLGVQHRPDLDALPAVENFCRIKFFFRNGRDFDTLGVIGIERCGGRIILDRKEFLLFRIVSKIGIREHHCRVAA